MTENLQEYSNWVRTMYPNGGNNAGAAVVAFGGASGHAATNGVSGSGAEAAKWRISATGADGADRPTKERPAGLPEAQKINPSV